CNDSNRVRDTALFSSSLSTIIACGYRRATGWKGPFPTSPATRLYAMLLRPDSAQKILKAALLLESISSSKQFAASTRGPEKPSARAEEARIREIATAHG